MIVEGKGSVAPPRHEVFLPGWRLDELYDLAQRREEARGYARSSRRWRQGLTDNPTFRGLVGEEACALWLRESLGVALAIDERDRREGDGGRDLCLCERSLQVKCRRNYGDAVMVRRQDDARRVVPLEADYFVQATWPWGGACDPAAVAVTIDGWLMRDDLTGGQLLHARCGDHLNLEVQNRDVRAADDLLDLFAGLLDVTVRRRT